MMMHVEKDFLQSIGQKIASWRPLKRQCIHLEVECKQAEIYPNLSKMNGDDVLMIVIKVTRNDS
jgi:hypothetical protein